MLSPELEVVGGGDASCMEGQYVPCNAKEPFQRYLPEVRCVVRTDQYWVKVLVPVMEGSLVRVSVHTV